MRHGGNERSKKSGFTIFARRCSYVTGQEQETAAAIERAIYIAQQVIANNTGYTAEQGTTPVFKHRLYCRSKCRHSN